MLADNVLENCEKLNYNLEEVAEHELNTQARAMGYEPIGYANTYDDGSKGILIQMPEGHNKYNNGNLIRHLVGEITTFVENLDTSDLDTYDFAEVYGFVIANTVVKHLARAMFPEDKDQQQHFTMIYLSRFLAHVAQIHAGDENIREEAVNSDPYLFKMAMLGIAEEDLNLEASEDSDATV